MSTAMLLFSCSSDGGELCFSFDQRSCNGDEWAVRLAEHDSWEKKTGELKKYFEGKGVDIKEISVDPDYHEAVCLACYVCPEGHRFFITINEDSEELLLNLNLLNLEEIACN